ncbi:MAG: hypothetical protein AAF611_19850 [Bacteroidota bacterium]
MNFVRKFFIKIALIAGIGCAIFGGKEISDVIEQIVDNTSRSNGDNYHRNRYTVTSHAGLNGGAIGLGIISGISLLALGITYIGKTEEK